MILIYSLILMLWSLTSAASLDLADSNRGAGFFEDVAGEWCGSGQLLGDSAQFRMAWASELDGKFVRLTYSVRGAVQMGAIAHYRTDMAHYGTDIPVGVWVDTRGEIVELSATLSEGALETVWRSPTEKGRTEYELTGANSLDVRDYFFNGSDWVLFGNASYVRMT